MSTLHSQSNPHFEFMDHDERTVVFSNGIKTGNDMLYVGSVNSFRTHVFKIDALGHKESLFNAPLTHFLDRIYENEDSIDILLYNLLDYDILLPGFYHITYHDGTLRVHDHAFDENLFDYYSSIDMALDSLGRYIMLYDDALLLYDGASTPSSIPISIRLDGIFQNASNDIFLFDDWTLYHFGADTLAEIMTSDHRIIDVVRMPDHRNAVLTKNTMTIWNETFDSMYSTVVLDQDIDGYRIQWLNGRFLFVEDALSSSHVQTLTPDGIIQPLYAPGQDGLAIRKVLDVSDSTLLVAGNVVSSFTSNTFFRQVDVLGQNNYDRIDLSLDSFRIHHTGTVDNGSYLSYHYTYDLVVQNKGHQPVHHFSIYSSNFHPFWFMAGFLEIHADTVLDPGASLTLQGAMHTANIPLPLVMEAFIPGADYKFDASYANNSIVTDIISSTEEPVSGLDFTFFPNPFSEVIHLESVGQDVAFSLMDSRGVSVTEGHMISEETIPTGHLPAGIYFLRVRDLGSQQVRVFKCLKY